MSPTPSGPDSHSDPEAPTDIVTDAELVARCTGGDAAAWSTLVRRYQRLVHTVALRIGLDAHAAADILQTVFMRLLRHIPRLDQPDRLQAWIVTTARREALKQRAGNERTISMSGDDGEADWDMADDTLLPEAALDALQQQHRVREALDRIDDRCRSLLTLLFDDPDDAPAYDQIASRLGMPVGSIGPTRSRCLAKLRSLIRP